MSFDYTTLVTDRSGSDYLRWQELRDKGYSNMTTAERSEWDAGLKGAYKTTDLNRVGSCLNDLYSRLYAAGYITPPNVFTAKTDWSASDVPTATDLTTYIRYVGIIRDALAQFSTTPATPTDSGALDITEANDIEQICKDIDKLINNMLAARYFSGELYAGEVS